jgi:hypothetical protein
MRMRGGLTIPYTDIPLNLYTVLQQLIDRKSGFSSTRTP